MTLQFCLAHLIRDVKFLTTLPDARDADVWDEVARGVACALWGDPPPGATDGRAVPKPTRGSAGRGAALCHAATCRRSNHCRNLAKRFETHGESYFRFITTPGVEPTNNLAEQAIRFVVIDRLITQGTRSEKGNRWCERIWTVIATCTQQGRSVFEYLEAAVGAWFADTEPPMLLPGI